MIGRPLYRYGSVTSTQDVARRYAMAGALHGTVVTAEYQTAGRGRLDRRWDAPPGASLLCSIVLRPTVDVANWGPLSLLTATAVRRVALDITGASAEVKWPNDVLLDGGKVSGILLQSVLGANPFVIAGIGINVNAPDGSLPEGATSLSQVADRPIDRELVLDLLCRELDQVIDAFDGALDPAQVDRFNGHLAMRGEWVTLRDTEREIQGRLIGIASNGALLLQTDRGRREILAGEILRGPRTVETA